jgi:hypothetical protein
MEKVWKQCDKMGDLRRLQLWKIAQVSSTKKLVIFFRRKKWILSKDLGYIHFGQFYHNRSWQSTNKKIPMCFQCDWKWLGNHRNGAKIIPKISSRMKKNYPKDDFK